jgi:hypothetical protein
MQSGGGVRMVTMLNQAGALLMGHDPAAQNRPTTADCQRVDSGSPANTSRR